jgi:hypothetical protein
MKLDRESHGVSYWHLSHQLPGVLICIEHSQPLWHSSLTMDHGRDVRWHLPQTDALSTPAWTPSSLGPVAMGLLEKFADLAMEVFLQPMGSQFNAKDLGAAYLRRLNELRPGTNPWNIEVLLAHAQEMQRYFACLDPVKDFEDAYGSAQGAASAIGDALSFSRSIPWNHLLMMTWLSLRPNQKWA